MVVVAAETKIIEDVGINGTIAIDNDDATEVFTTNGVTNEKKSSILIYILITVTIVIALAFVILIFIIIRKHKFKE